MASLLFPWNSTDAYQCFLRTEAALADRSAKQVTVQLTGKVDNHENACVVSSSFSLCPSEWKKQSNLKLERWRARVHEVFIDEQVRQEAGEGAALCSCEYVATECFLISLPIACPLLKRQSVVIFLK